VYAAREGTVFRYKDDSNEAGITGSYTKKANYIIIRHDDGSYGCYWHLQQNGVLVKSGRVNKGQLIALSGATGQVIQPHLHFSVKAVLNYKMDSFRKTKFETSRGVLFLEQGNTYRNP
jgi:murein DD-endopeptidase MepM/ murein hydrolase activator NlpD